MILPRAEALSQFPPVAVDYALDALAGNVLAAAGPLGKRGRVAVALDGPAGRARWAGEARLVRVLRRRDFRAGKKGGDCVGPTKKGKGTKLVVVVDGQGIPLARTVHSASPSETKMIEPTLGSTDIHSSAVTNAAR